MSDLNIVKVVPVVLETHPNADSLSIVRIDGYNVIVRTADWINEDRGAYIPPDNVVDITREEFKWLDEGIVGRITHRIKTKKLRGIMSQGLLIPIHKDVREDTSALYQFNIGEDITDYLGVKRYESQEDLALGQGEQARGPVNPGPKYDIESWFKYKYLIPDGTPVVLTEKLHGTNARFTFQEDRETGELKMHCGSRIFYRKEDIGNVYWRALAENTWIEQFCREYPGVILYGEIFGWVQSLKYGHKPGEITFRSFDVYEPVMGTWWGWTQFYNNVTFEGQFLDRIVPIIKADRMSDDLINKHISGKSTLYPGHMREGVVIKPVEEMNDYRHGRVILKAVSPEYLEKA